MFVYGTNQYTVLAETHQTSALSTTELIYLPTASGPMPVAAVINGVHHAVHSDHLNTPRRLSDAAGQTRWQWPYSGYGEIAPQATPASGQPAISFDLRYPGQLDDGNGLFYNWNRFYDPRVGRYTSADPIGLEGGWNRFGYVGGNPLGAVDPEGLNAIPVGPLLIPGVPNPTADAQRDLANRLSRALRDDRQKTYQTYTRYNPLTGQCYSGRTSGYDTPENNVRNRGYGQPHLTSEGFLPPVLDRSSTNKDAIRGREQQLIELFGGAKSTKGFSRNEINGISDWNFLRQSYLNTATHQFGIPISRGQCTCQ